ncbi:hypothetical protein F2P79_001229 [Pimephales promelas]|nr:hypothetical protein F2P79_001229 [Pimephales promelas]
MEIMKERQAPAWSFIYYIVAVQVLSPGGRNRRASFRTGAETLDLTGKGRDKAFSNPVERSIAQPRQKRDSKRGESLTFLMITDAPQGEILHGAPDRGRLTVILNFFHFLMIAPTVVAFSPSFSPSPSQPCAEVYLNEVFYGAGYFIPHMGWPCKLCNTVVPGKRASLKHYRLHLCLHDAT